MRKFPPYNVTTWGTVFPGASGNSPRNRVNEDEAAWIDNNDVMRWILSLRESLSGLFKDYSWSCKTTCRHSSEFEVYKLTCQVCISICIRSEAYHHWSFSRMSPIHRFTNTRDPPGPWVMLCYIESRGHECRLSLIQLIRYGYAQFPVLVPSRL